MSLRFFTSPARPACIAVFLALAALAASGCKKNRVEVEERDRYFQVEAVRVEEAHQNRLAQEPTGFLRQRATDPIFWQPWGPELFDNALKEQKQIFVLVSSGNYAHDREVKKKINEDPALIKTLQDNYLCGMIDVHAHPEIGFHAFYLSAEVRRPVGFPMMIWFSHERNPVAWLPLGRQDIDAFSSVFGNSHEMVARIWRDDPRYVIKNSAADNEERAKRALTIVAPVEDEFELLAEIEKAARSITALYDPTSRHMDGAGGLIPFSMLQFAAKLANDPAISETVRKRLLEMITGHLDLLLESAIYDPLDGGFFSSRRTLGWSLPNFSKNSTTQLEGVLALVAAARLTGEPRYLDEAMRVLHYAETRFASDAGGIGLYEYPASEEASTKAYLWSLERLREILPADEFPVVEKCYGVTGLGNIPLESDPERDYFRLNSLRAALSPQAAAAELGLTPERASELLESARKRLLVQREEALEEEKHLVESTQIAAVIARYALALAEAGVAAGDEALLARASKVLNDLRTRNSSENGFMRIAAQGDRRGIRARATDYAVAIDALLKVYRYTLDTEQLVWADDLMEQLLRDFLDDEGLLREEPASDLLLATPSYSSSMIFGNSTWGVIFGPLKRFHQLTGAENLQKLIANLAGREIAGVRNLALTHTDFGQGALVHHTDTLIYLDGPRDDAEFQSLHAVLQESAHESVTVVRLDSALPKSFTTPQPGNTPRAVVIRAGKEVGTAATAAELRALLSAAESE